MGEMHKYTDVIRLGHRSTVGVLNVGDHIVVQEKVDGANASFRLSETGTSVLCFSRNMQLDEHNTLRGFYQWVMDNISPYDLSKDFVYFGEWATKHRLDYGENADQFYLFDVYDVELGKYIPFETVKEIAAELGWKTVPVLYVGPYLGFDHLKGLVGQSMLRERGEGIVVKNYAYETRWGEQLFVKLVTEQFAEATQQRKARDPNAPASPEVIYAQTYVTRGRVEKFVHKLADEGIELDVCRENYGVLLKELNPRIFEDLLKEESDDLPENYDVRVLRKAINTCIANALKQIESEQEVLV